MQTIYDKLSKIIFFNLILRTFLEGYMEFSLSSLMNITNVTLDIIDSIAYLGDLKRQLRIIYCNNHMFRSILFPLLRVVAPLEEVKHPQRAACDP